jgi:hypothetical protein
MDDISFLMDGWKEGRKEGWMDVWMISLLSISRKKN